MAGSSRRIVVEFLGNDKTLSSTAREVDGNVSKLGDRFKKFGAAAAAGLAVAGGVAVKFGTDAVNAASDLNETLSKSNVIFGKQAPAMERWAAGAARSAGLSKQAALSAAAGFGDMFSQLGFAGGEAANMSKNVVQLSADLGSFNNLETSDVADRMSAAFRGEYDSLQALIPNINAARVETEALAMTGKSAASELTAQEKAAATLAIVQKDGARAAGDFARTSGGLANQSKILRAQWENLQATAGQKLLPIITKLVTWFNDKALPALSKVGGWISDNLIPIFKRFGGEGGGALDRLRNAVAPVVEAYQGLFAVVAPIVRQIVAVIRKNWGPISEWARKNFGVLKEIVTGVIAIIAERIKIVTNVIRVVWKRWGDEILAVAKRIFKAIGSVISGALKVIRGVIKTVLSVLRGDWRGAWNGIKDIFKGVWQAIKAVLSLAWDGIKAIMRRGLDFIVDGVKAIPGKIKALGGLFKDAGRWVIDQMVDGLKNAAGIISGIAGNVWTAVKGLLNGAISKINAALEFRISLPGPDIHVNPPNIPALAKGGIVNKPTLALIGEDGPEAVVPLSAKHAPGGSLGGLGGNVVVNIHGALDPVAVGRQVEKVLSVYTRATGRPVQVRTL